MIRVRTICFAFLLMCSNVSAPKILLSKDLTGQIQVLVYDSQGHSVPNAPIFITDDSQKLIREPQTRSQIEMTAGRYQIYSIMVRQQGDYVQRLKSHVAVAHVQAGGVETILLTLYPFNPALIENPGITTLASR